MKGAFCMKRRQLYASLKGIIKRKLRPEGRARKIVEKIRYENVFKLERVFTNIFAVAYWIRECI
jgi:hypothetical protein